MERIKELNRYQKFILILSAAMALAFTAVYIMTVSRVGFEYRGEIFVPREEDGGTVYSGRFMWEQASFTVAGDRTVTFQWGDRVYGPYTAREDPSAVPEDEDNARDMTGVELRRGDEILFRGGVLDAVGLVLIDEDGSWANSGVVGTSDGVMMDNNGRVIDPAEPSAAEILGLMAGPEMTGKGLWPMWLEGLFCCAVNILSILFADQWFRWEMSFKIRDPDSAEPTDLQIMGRYVGWTIVPVIALAIFIKGLR